MGSGRFSTNRDAEQIPLYRSIMHRFVAVGLSVDMVAGLVVRIVQAAIISAELSCSLKVRLVVETRRNRPRIVRNRCVPVCGHRAGYSGLGLAQLGAPIRVAIEELRPDPQKLSRPFKLSRVVQAAGLLDVHTLSCALDLPLRPGSFGAHFWTYG
jgi:hypothetical protein